MQKIIPGSKEFYLRDWERVDAHLSNLPLPEEMRKSLKNRLFFIKFALSKLD